jgi:hypothetical protein
MTTNYKNKYLKYKLKYLELQQLIGGSYKSAEHSFYKKIKHQYVLVAQILNDDLYLKNQIGNFILPSKELIDVEKKDNAVVNNIFNYFKTKIDGKNIEVFCNLYLNGLFGNPNSVENIGRFNDAIKKLLILNNYNKDTKKKDDFESLSDLEKYIDDNYELFNEINERDEKKNKKKQKQILIEQNGKNDVEVVFETNKLIIYKPTSEAGSKYYGRNTKWCTASDNNNMFDYYNDKGPLYIIQSKKNDLDKYQVHFESKQFMNVYDHPVGFEYLISHFNDNDYTYWMYEHFNVDNYTTEIILSIKEKFEGPKLLILLNKVVKLKISMQINEIEVNELLRYCVNLKKLIIQVNLKDKLNDLINELFQLETIELAHEIVSPLVNLVNLKELYINFDQSLGNSLNNLTNLKKIIFCDNFDQLIENSFNNLINLTEIQFGRKFNKPLGNSLSNLTNLKKISFGDNFDQLIENSFNNLINLTEIKFGEKFNKPLGNSLNKLVNLKKISFGDNFDQSIENVFDNLNSLIEINFGKKFNKPLGNSFNNLTNLKKISFGYFYSDFNQSLENSLNNLTNLREINFGNFGKFDKPLGDSLDKLIDLETLYLGNDFNQSIGNSLDKLTNLKVLHFGNKFDKPLGDSLHKLTNLETLSLGNDFNQSIGNSLDKLTNLKVLHFGNKFDKLLNNSLYNLTNLTELRFGNDFNQPLGDSLSKLTSLLSLSFINKSNTSGKFNQPLGESLKTLTNLNQLSFGSDFKQPLGNSLDTLVNLQYVMFSKHITEEEATNAVRNAKNILGIHTHN